VRAAGAGGSTASACTTAAGHLAHADEFGYLAEALAQARRAMAAAAAKQRRGPNRSRAAGAAAAAGLLQRHQGRAVLDWSDVVAAEREDEAALMTAAAAGADAAPGAFDAGECVTHRWGSGWGRDEGGDDGRGCPDERSVMTQWLWQCHCCFNRAVLYTPAAPNTPTTR